MSLKIRLTRGGAKKRPYYRIVVADSRSPRDGRFIEKVGTYDPMKPKDDAGRVILDNREDPGLARQGRPADRPRPALPRRRRPPEASAAQQPAEGRARQEGPGARRRQGRRGCRRPKARLRKHPMKRGRSNKRDLRPLPSAGEGAGVAGSARGGRRGAALASPARHPLPARGARAQPAPAEGRPRPRRRVRPRPWPQGRGAAEIPYRRSAGDRRLQAADREQRPNLFPQERAARSRRRARSSHRHRRRRDDARGGRGAQPRAALCGARQASAARRGGRVPARRPDRSLASRTKPARSSAPSSTCPITAAAIFWKSRPCQAARPRFCPSPRPSCRVVDVAGKRIVAAPPDDLFEPAKPAPESEDEA